MFHGKLHDEEDDELPRYEEEEAEEGAQLPHEGTIEIDEVVIEEDDEAPEPSPTPSPRKNVPAAKRKRTKKPAPRKKARQNRNARPRPKRLPRKRAASVESARHLARQQQLSRRRAVGSCRSASITLGSSLPLRIRRPRAVVGSPR